MSVSKAKTGSVAGVAGGYAPLDSNLKIPVEYLTEIGATAKSSSDQVITTGTPTAITFASADDFDTDGFHDTVTNNSRMTIPAGLGGKYLVIGYLCWLSESGGTVRQARIYKNGSGSGYAGTANVSGTHYIQVEAVAILDLAAGDYVELFAFHDKGSNSTVSGSVVPSRLALMRM